MLHIDFFLILQIRLILQKQLFVQISLAVCAQHIHPVLFQTLEHPVHLLCRKRIRLKMIQNFLVDQDIFLRFGFRQQTVQLFLKPKTLVLHRSPLPFPPFPA